jgi:hypothetical protein
MKLLSFALAVSALSTSAIALAQDKAQCFDAASQAQSMRDAHKLVEAREQLRICARPTCPSMVQKDCTTWLDGVEQALPTIVLSAKDAEGRDLIDVSVTVDGQPLASKLQGDAVPMNPGPHTFHFQTGDGRSVDEQVLIREGVKNRDVTVVLAKPGGEPAAAGPAGGASDHASPTATPDVSSQGGHTLRTIGWILGGVGVFGVALGGTFGVLAMSDKNGAHCDASGGCQPGPLNAARTAAAGSTASFIVGGLCAGGGIALLLAAPRAKAPSAPAVGLKMTLAPVVGAAEAGLRVAGSW